MGKNVIREEFLADSTWTCPAGVTEVKVPTTGMMFSQAAVDQAGFGILPTGDLYGWGAGASGVSGLGGTANTSSPTLVLGYLKWRQIVTGGSVSLGITSLGDAYGWGANNNGQLGLGNVTSQSSPVLVLGGLKFRKIACSSASTLGIDSNGVLYAWGNNLNGELGLGDIIPRSSPVAVLGGLKWTDISICNSSAFGIDSNQNLYAWGVNGFGQLGLGNVTPQSSPVLVLGGLKWKQVSAGNGFTLGITNTNTIYSWGLNRGGALGIGNNNILFAASSPTVILGSLKWKQVEGYTNYAVGITSTGDAYAWGTNTNGQLGVGDTTSRSSPVAVLGGLKWLQLGNTGAQTQAAVVAINSSGDLYAWGVNNLGGLGLGNTIPQSSPVIVVGGYKYSSVYNSLVNQRVLEVVPGTTYQVSIFGQVAMYNYHGLYQSPYSSGALPIRIVLEYEG